MTAADARARDHATPRYAAGGGRIRWGRVALHVFLIVMAIVWLFPLAWAVYTAAATVRGHAGRRGYISLPRTLQLRQLHRRLERRRLRAALPQHADRRGPGRAS